MYTQFYRLHGEPFLLTPDHRFYFESSVHSQAMSHLTYGISRGEGFIVITGEIGAGKTTLVKRLCASIDAQRILTAHVVTTQLEGADLLRMVAAAFGLKDLPSDKSSLLLRLQTFFDACLLHNYRTLLIVDEAQNLTVNGLEELRMLSNFQTRDVAPFQSFLIGQPQFRAILSNPDLEQLRQRIIATYHLGPMNREECGEYLIHRLQQVGWRSDPSFDPSAVDAIFNHTGGIPRRINTLCNRLLLLGYLDDLHHFSSVEVNKVAADLATEMMTSEHSNGVAKVPTSGAVAHSEPDATDRLGRLEQRVARQEEFMKRAAWIVRDLLAFQQSDTE
jgi:putative secretion ATPase (PEP-CTERM system associated)